MIVQSVFLQLAARTVIFDHKMEGKCENLVISSQAVILVTSVRNRKHFCAAIRLRICNQKAPGSSLWIFIYV